MIHYIVLYSARASEEYLKFIQSEPELRIFVCVLYGYSYPGSSKLGPLYVWVIVYCFMLG